MTGVLLLGFLVGLRHALEADHLAAVATLARRARTLAEAGRHGIAWGAGHTLTLFVVAALIAGFGAALPAAFSPLLEFLVGLMLIGLGADVLRRLNRDRIHFHVHRHTDGVRHFHAHAHAGEAPGSHDAEHHEHEHHRASRFPMRTFLVGLMHGLAGSSVLTVLALEQMQSPSLALVYVLVFGAGSIVGMLVLSIIIAVPLRLSADRLTWMHNGLSAVIALVTMGIGVYLCVLSGPLIAAA